MLRCYSIDWLSLWCTGFRPVANAIPEDKPAGDVLTLRTSNGHSRFVIEEKPAHEDTLFALTTSQDQCRYVINPAARRWGYKIADHGTRQFRKLMQVTYLNDVFADVCYEPCSRLFTGDVCMVKFANRVLYMNDCWELIDHFIEDHGLKVQNVTRCDICCDFNRFECSECVPFIEDFLASRLRHVGRSRGGAYFNELRNAEIEQRGKCLVYSGLSFGGHDSDAHIYLYNKTFELLCTKDKPYIKDLWVRSGLDTSKDVWRLEVSLKSKAMKFNDRATKKTHRVDVDSLHEVPDVVKIYHTFAGKLFKFVKNDHHISNISRETPVDLWGDDAPAYDRAVIRPVTGSNRTEKILIHQLHDLAAKYRDPCVQSYGDIAREVATTLASGCDLDRWYKIKQVLWDKPTHK